MHLINRGSTETLLHVNLIVADLYMHYTCVFLPEALLKEVMLKTSDL
jgi:hypothetical protein